LRAIEPDPRLAVFLRQTVPHSSLQVDQSTFEDADLAPVSFDLGIAATSFHWLEQVGSLAKVHKKVGGWWAMWWTHFGDGKEYDAFQAATYHLFIDIPQSPSHGRQGGPPFALDREARLHDLFAAGFQLAEVDLWRRTLRIPLA
jgi:hypothetical protein